jgi:hypothetical protein
MLQGSASRRAMADPAVAWLLRSRDPSIRDLTRTEVLGESPRSRAAREDRDHPNGARVRALLRGQRRDGGFGVHPYSKWTGAHWRPISLVELAIAPDHPRARPAAQHVLAWLGSWQRKRTLPTMNGLVRHHAPMEGNPLAACCRLGLARDPRVRALVDSLLAACGGPASSATRGRPKRSTWSRASAERTAVGGRRRTTGSPRTPRAARARWSTGVATGRTS